MSTVSKNDITCGFTYNIHLHIKYLLYFTYQISKNFRNFQNTSKDLYQHVKTNIFERRSADYGPRQ